MPFSLRYSGSAGSSYGSAPSAIAVAPMDAIPSLSLDAGSGSTYSFTPVRLFSVGSAAVKHLRPLTLNSTLTPLSWNATTPTLNTPDTRWYGTTSHLATGRPAKTPDATAATANAIAALFIS